MTKPDGKGSLSATRDHVYPKSLGGTWQVWACLACNNLKGDMLPHQWEAFRDANPKWWKLYRSGNKPAMLTRPEIISGQPAWELARRIVRGLG